MDKRCIICGGSASFAIKGFSETYCRECALVNFSDLELLEHLDDRTQRVSELVDEKLQEP